MNGKVNKTNGAILTFSRCGSTTLSSVLSINKHIRLLGEPFHLPEEKPFSHYNAKARDLKSFDDSLAELLSDFNIIQHKFANSYLEWNLKIIGNDNLPILLLYRKNALKREISKIISSKVKSWDHHKDPVLDKKFEPFSIEKIKRGMDFYKYRLRFYREKIMDLKPNYMELAYEDLYSKGHTFEDKMKVIRQITDHFGFGDIYYPKYIQKTRKYLNASRKKNSGDTYNQIPNIDDIEKKLGSPENGYLFKD